MGSMLSRGHHGDREVLRQEYDRLFADMEFRSKRAAMMNYHEADRYDKLAERYQTIATVVGALGLSGIGASVAKTKRVTDSKAGVAGIIALPVCGILSFLASGSTSLAPTMEEKAKDHVKAGAGWQRIARSARSYRIQIKHLRGKELDSPILATWYRQIVQESETVSKIVPIKPDTYVKFEQPKTVRQRMDKKEGLLNEYLDIEAREGKGCS